MNAASGFPVCGALIFIGVALHRIADAIYEYTDKTNIINRMNLIDCAIQKVGASWNGKH